MTSLSTWLRAAIGSSRRGGLTRAPMLAGRRRTRQAVLPGHAIPRPGPPLSLPWRSSPASPDEIRAVSRRGSRGQSVPRLPFADGARDWPARANPDAARGAATSSKATGPRRRLAISACYARLRDQVGADREPDRSGRSGQVVGFRYWSACQGGEHELRGDTDEVCEPRCASLTRSCAGPWPVAVPRWWRRISAENLESGPDLHKRRSACGNRTHDLRITRRRRATPQHALTSTDRTPQHSQRIQ